MSDRQTTIGKYQIIREIARSNDIVYEAYDPLMNRRVALKELAMPGGMNDSQKEDRVKRFVREAKAAGSLNHPNIVTIYECGEEGGKYFIAMEFLDGHTLRNELDTHGFLSPEKAMGIVLEVLHGLDYAHQNGVIHRDIKPENIQLLPDGRVKLTDFGIARLTFEPNITMDGQVFGTPSYMSPEQVVGKEIDARSDLFGVGVLLYEMLAGEKPFKGDSVVSITYSIMNVHPTQPSQANHTVWQFISKALEKSPQLRYSGAADMIRSAEAAEKSLHSVVLDPLPTQQFGATHNAPPVGNPYMTTFSNPYAPPAPPVAVYPYDPYQQGQQIQYDPYQQGLGMQQQPQPTQGYPPGYAPMPIYYPPPKQPFMTPETKTFFGKLFVTAVILGTLFGLVVAVVWGLGTAWERSKNQERDASLRRELQVQEATMPVDERINQRQAMIPKLNDEVSKQEEQKKLAADYQIKGRQYVQKGDLVSASAAFQRGLELDGYSSSLAFDMANLFVRQARQEIDESQRVELWDSAATYFASAASNEPDPEQKKKFGDNAALYYYNVAGVLGRQGDRRVACDRLYLARQLASPGSRIAVDVDSLLQQLTE